MGSSLNGQTNAPVFEYRVLNRACPGPEDPDLLETLRDVAKRSLNRAEEDAERIIAELHRGATALHGRGMYLKQERDVLLVALTVTEIEHLKALVNEEDPHAFITIIPAKEVVGQGFVPLENG